MSRVLVIASQKGGTAKSTTAMAWASVLASKTGGGLKILLVDADPQESALEWAERAQDRLKFDYDASPDPRTLAKLHRASDYDLIICDTPGNLRERDLLQALLSSADDVLVPVEPSGLAISPTRRTIEDAIEPAGVPYWVLPVKVDPHNASRDTKDLAAVCKSFGWPMLKTPIRSYKVHAKAPIVGATVTDLKKMTGEKKAKAALEDYQAAVAEWRKKVKL